jgi:hypothetical protein
MIHLFSVVPAKAGIPLLPATEDGSGAPAFEGVTGGIVVTKI